MRVRAGGVGLHRELREVAREAQVAGRQQGPGPVRERVGALGQSGQLGRESAAGAGLSVAPAAVFATSMRLTGRLVRTRPLMAQVLMNSRSSLLGAGAGHAPHALADITRAAEAGRFTVDDPVLALACTAGWLLAAMSLGSLDGADLDAVVDGATGNVLRMFGVSEDEVRALTALPLPSEDVQAGRA